MLDKLFNRDLEARRKALLDESNDLVAHFDDLKRRSRRLRDQGLNEQLLVGARAGDQEKITRLEASMHEAEAHDAELTQLERDLARVREDLDAIATSVTQRTVRLAQFALALQFVAAAVGLWLPGPSAKAAHAIHLDYYSAVAAITPVLLVAGFVELAILGLSTGAWAVLSFAVPAVGAGGAALSVLATHQSTPYTYYLTIWGLVATLSLLISYVIFHTTSSNRT